MTETEVWGDVVEFLAAVTGLTVIKSHESGPRPAKPYMMVNFINLREVKEHHIDTEYVDTEVENTEVEHIIEAVPVIESEWEFSVHSYGDSPTTPFRKIRSIARIGGPHQGLDRLLTLFDVGRVANVPDVINNKWEPRSNAKVFIRAYTRDGFVIDVIDQAPLQLNRT